MKRIVGLVTFVLASALATAAWADTPCQDKAGDELKACLAEAVENSADIALPTCTDKEGDALTACKTAATAYQKALAEATGEPCAGFADEALTSCKDSKSKKKGKGLSKHEGTKMERMSGAGEDDE